MTVEANRPNIEATKAKAFKTGDVDYDVGALASRHGISVDEARAIMERCGADADCLDDEARKLKAMN